MNIRGWLQSNPTVIMVLAVLFIGGSGIYIWSRLGPAKPVLPTQAYFYDLSTGALFSAALSEIPPIDAPSGGGNGVRAYVFGCGNCESPKVAYLATVTPDARQVLVRPAETPEAMRLREAATTAGQRVALPPDPGQAPRWIAPDVPAATDILSAPSRLCDDPGSLVSCLP